MFDTDLIYYDRPYQVVFLRPDLEVPLYEKGIAFKYHVIAARDGEMFTTRQVLHCAKRYGVHEDYAIVESFDWVPLEVN
jgi:hypothetical protein